ncbi:hypothetical protein H5410_010313 [Solanum commersonii]|uniref:Uncharacterized protein n=1 Tax=Solanum commersonii TaxID=4109 RepID=A0A9J6AM37_SOLCO|nr:hypothetical protein H5410_010313 [Solanum commersonii]
MVCDVTTRAISAQIDTIEIGIVFQPWLMTITIGIFDYKAAAVKVDEKGNFLNRVDIFGQVESC